MPLFMQAIIDPITGFRIPVLLLEVLVWLGYFNSACNPIIYALFYPSFKKCFHCIITMKILSSNSSTMNCHDSCLSGVFVSGFWFIVFDLCLSILSCVSCFAFPCPLVSLVLLVFPVHLGRRPGRGLFLLLGLRPGRVPR